MKLCCITTQGECISLSWCFFFCSLCGFYLMLSLEWYQRYLCSSGQCRPWPLTSATLAQTPTKMPSQKSHCGIGEPPIMDFGVICSPSSLIFNSYFPAITSNGIPCSLEVQVVHRVSRTCPQLHRQSHCEVAYWGRRWFDLGINVSPQKFLACQTDSSFSRGGYHWNEQTKHRHYTLHTFKSDGIAYCMIHAFSSEHSTVFLNGGKVWKEGGHRLDVKWDCEQLWYVIALFLTCVLTCSSR